MIIFIILIVTRAGSDTRILVPPIFNVGKVVLHLTLSPLSRDDARDSATSSLARDSFSTLARDSFWPSSSLLVLLVMLHEGIKLYMLNFRILIYFKELKRILQNRH